MGVRQPREVSWNHPNKVPLEPSAPVTANRPEAVSRSFSVRVGMTLAYQAGVSERLIRPPTSPGATPPA